MRGAMECISGEPKRGNRGQRQAWASRGLEVEPLCKVSPKAGAGRDEVQILAAFPHPPTPASEARPPQPPVLKGQPRGLGSHDYDHKAKLYVCQEGTLYPI